MRKRQRIRSAKPARLLVLTTACCSALLLGSCHKVCHCYGYDNTHTFYTEEEVDERGGTCSEMMYFANVRRYSLCEWDY